MQWLTVIVAAGIFAVGGCATTNNNNEEDLAARERELPDGFLVTGCNVVADCDDNNPCTIDTCAFDHSCQHQMIDCSAQSDQCNEGTCDVGTGECLPMPSNEGAGCMTMNNQPGQCLSGDCSMIPQCQQNTFDYLDCSSFGNTASGNTSSGATIGWKLHAPTPSVSAVLGACGGSNGCTMLSVPWPNVPARLIDARDPTRCRTCFATGTSPACSARC